MLWYPFASTVWRARLAWAKLSRPASDGLSPEQVAAWSEFYVDEERRGEARPVVEYARMLVRHGCPDVGNPIPNDMEEHFLMHPGGFVACEFDRCLRPALTELDVQRGEQALARLGLLAHLDCPMASARAYWADDDLRFAMALSCIEGRWDLAGARPSRVVVNALRRGLLEPQAAPGILIARRMAEQEWHRAPWAKRSATPAPTSPMPNPPPLGLAAWRASRVASGGGQEAAPSPVEAP